MLRTQFVTRRHSTACLLFADSY